MRLMGQTKIYEEHFAYRYNLRSVTAGWTLESRKAYFKWFNDDHTDDQHRYDYREWFNRVNQQPRIAGNARTSTWCGRPRSRRSPTPRKRIPSWRRFWRRIRSPGPDAGVEARSVPRVLRADDRARRRSRAVGTVRQRIPLRTVTSGTSGRTDASLPRSSP